MFREYMVWISGDCSFQLYRSLAIVPLPMVFRLFVPAKCCSSKQFDRKASLGGGAAKTPALGRECRRLVGISGQTDRTQPLAVRLQDSELRILPVDSCRRMNMSAQLLSSNKLNYRTSLAGDRNASGRSTKRIDVQERVRCAR